MSVTKNPAITSLDPDSLCYSIYSELYNQFFNAQQRKDEAHPYGIEEGDDTSIRLHNAAYGFAYAIAGAVNGGGGSEGGILLDYLRKEGGDMAGTLRANYGFEAGVGNKTLMTLYKSEDDAGVRFAENIDVRGSILMSGRQAISYEAAADKLSLSARYIDFGDSGLLTRGDMLFGNTKETGIYISPSVLLVSGNHVYHQGNANRDSIDWTMRNARVYGELTVSGEVNLSGMVKALHGAELGYGGKALMSFADGEIAATGFLSFAPDFGIKIDGRKVLYRVGEKDMALGGIGGNLLFGGDANRIRLLCGLTDVDGDYTLLSSHGAAYFPDSLTVRHNFGQMLLSSYRIDSGDEGMVIHKRLRFDSDKGAFLYGDRGGIAFHADGYSTILKYVPSSSLYKPLDGKSDSLIIDTEADFVIFNKPVEAKSHIGIDNSMTRLADGRLFFTENLFLLAATDGIRHYGNAYMTGDIGSEVFSSGFAGSGWAIQRNKTTGNTTATVDELTVRKKMRIYELEIQKTNAANGSLWISHHCQGDSVERID